MVSLENIISVVENFAPTDLAGDWDNVGLILGDRNRKVKRILVALDIDIEVAKEASRLGADLILTHHPLIFSPVKKINSDTPVGRCILYMLKNDIALYSAHTNLDAAKGGLNDYLAYLYGLEDVKPIDIVYTDGNGDKYGLGRKGTLDREMSLAALAQKVGMKLGIENISFVGNPEHKVKTVALCSGGGGSRVSEEIEADVYITGDIKYSNARDAAALGLNLISVGHFETERFCMSIFEKILGDFDVEICKSHENENVFKTIII